MGLLSWLYGADPASKGAALDAKLASQEADQFAAGKISKDVYQQELANAASGAAENTDAVLGQAFDEGWTQGKDNLIAGAGKLGGALGDVIDAAGKGAGNFVLKVIPWWVWALLALALGIYFYPVLRPIFKRL